MSINKPTSRVEFDHVSKRYRLGTSASLRDTLSALLSGGNGADDTRRILWAIRNVTFKVAAGESLGLIGPNGSGKTTTLKLLSNITQPTSGRIAVQGRMSSLIELGAGFHPELTGRENIYLNGAILGLRQNEIAQRLDAIVDFSGLERFIDTPLKRYSSGMYVRLGFAVAAHVEPSILLVDEVLAVGDAEFRQKCVSRMMELRQAGAMIIFVSHNMHLVRRLCDRVVLLCQGQVAYEGSPDGAIAAYEQLIGQAPDRSAQDEAASNANLLITDVQVVNRDGNPQQQFTHGDLVTIKVAFASTSCVLSPVVRARLVADDNTVVAMIATHHAPATHNDSYTLQGQGTFSVTLPSLEVTSGRYSVEVRILDVTDTQLIATGHSDVFFVQSPGYAYELDRGRYVPKATWNLPSTVEGR